MSDRFSNLKKIPKQPAARLLAACGMKLKTKLDAPASASVPDVLTELESKKAWVDMVMLLAASLPGREAVWWACLAARDVLGPDGSSPCLKAAEAWVLEPREQQRTKLQAVLDTADVDDPGSQCATAALYAPGNLGPGEMSEHPAPPGALVGCVFASNIEAIKEQADPMAHLRLLIERGLDIAGGGNGRVEAETAKEQS